MFESAEQCEASVNVRHFLRLWWISWFGFIGGFFMIGVGDYRRESSPARHFSLALMVIVGILWTVFFITDAKVKTRTPEIVRLLSLMGTLLAAVTVVGIGFFVLVAPRIQ